MNGFGGQCRQLVVEVALVKVDVLNATVDQVSTNLMEFGLILYPANDDRGVVCEVAELERGGSFDAGVTRLNCLLGR